MFGSTNFGDVWVVFTHLVVCVGHDGTPFGGIRVRNCSSGLGSTKVPFLVPLNQILAYSRSGGIFTRTARFAVSQDKKGTSTRMQQVREVGWI